jgi:hypothetical protein
MALFTPRITGVFGYWVEAFDCHPRGFGDEIGSVRRLAE